MILFLITSAPSRSSIIAMYTRFPYKSSNSDLLITLSNSEVILEVFPPLIRIFNSSEIVLKIIGMMSTIPSTRQRRQH